MWFSSRKTRRDARVRSLRDTSRPRLEQLEARLVLSTYTVTNTDDSGDGSLRQAILEANANLGSDIIDFASGVAGTITLTSGELAITDAIDLQGPGAGVIMVSGNHASRVFRVTASATLSGLTITGGTASAGGGILNDDTLTVESCILSGNSVPVDGGSGGGIYNDGIMTVRNSTLSGNSAGGALGTNGGGGGITNFSTLTVEGSTFIGNTGSYQGGAIGNFGALTVRDSTFSGNSTALYGGGILNFGALTVDRSTFSGNSAAYGGGLSNNYGLGSQSGTATVRDSTFSGNSAPQAGGGLLNGGNGTLTVESSTFSGNSTNVDGGGLANLYGGILAVHNSTLAGNTATYGGGINYRGALSVAGSTISGNSDGGTSRGFGGLYTRGPTTLANTIVAANFGVYGGRYDIDGVIDSSSSHNLVGVDSNLSGITNGTTGNLIGTAAAPINPMLGSLQNNGGPTQTMALLPGSPALDAGDNSLIPAGVTTDQRGTGFARIENGTVDIGAYELVQNSPPTASAGGPYVISEGGLLSLDGSGSHDPDPLDTLTYSWDVNGDGTFGDASGVSPTLSWTQLQALGIDDGPRTVSNVRVRVDDGHGHVVDSPATTLTLNNAAPTAVLQTNSGVTYGNSATAPLANSFDPSATDTSAGLHYAFALDTDTTGSATYASTAGSTNSVNFGVVNAGTHTIYARIIDKDSGSRPYSGTLLVAKATQTINWSNPAAINYGTPLSGTQLNATVTGMTGGTAPGALTYSPSAGTVLLAGTQTLTATAAETVNYSAATKSVSLVVNPYVSSG